jgi:hypothetical protein
LSSQGQGLAYQHHQGAVANFSTRKPLPPGSERSTMVWSSACQIRARSRWRLAPGVRKPVWMPTSMPSQPHQQQDRLFNRQCTSSRRMSVPAVALFPAVEAGSGRALHLWRGTVGIMVGQPHEIGTADLVVVTVDFVHVVEHFRCDGFGT